MMRRVGTAAEAATLPPGPTLCERVSKGGAGVQAGTASR